MNTLKQILLIKMFLLILVFKVSAQDRFQQIEQTLKDLASSTATGLNEKVDMSVAGVSIQEFLRGLAEANNLNISVDPALSIKVYNNFTNEKVMNILLFLAKEYDLDIRFVGSIMSFYKYSSIPVATPVRPVNIKFNGFTNLLTLDLQSDTLEKVAKKITQVTGKNVILSSGISNKIVSVYIQDMPFDNAIQKMAFSNNLKSVKTSDDFYIIKPLEEGDDPLAAMSTGQNNNNNLPVFPKRTKITNGQASGELYVHVRKDSSGQKMVTVDAINVPIVEALRKVSDDAGVNYFLLSEIKGNATMRVMNVFFDEFLTKLFQGTDYTYKVEYGDLYLVGDRKLEGLRAHRIFQFQYRTVEGIADAVPTELKKGVEIKEFKNLNSIVLSGPLPQIMELEGFLKQLDRVVPQIMIELIMVDITRNRTVSTGITAGVDSTVKTGGGTIFPGLDFTFSSKAINDLIGKLGSNSIINLGKVNSNFYVALQALEKTNNVDIRSTPKLSTLNGHTASLLIGSTIYYANQTQNILGSLTPQTTITRQFNEIKANLNINIQPIVAGDDQVTLNIDVSNAEFTPPSDPTLPPGTNNRQFKSTIRVRNEEMIVLGGLEKTTKTTGASGVPLLSRIPILKWIFSSKTNGKARSVTLVFIRPTIVY